MFHRGEPLTETVWEKLMLGLSTRKYGQAVREFTAAYGLEKSAVSEHFIEARVENLTSRWGAHRFDTISEASELFDHLCCPCCSGLLAHSRAALFVAHALMKDLPDEAGQTMGNRPDGFLEAETWHQTPQQ
jgi:hypothetical protein